MTPKNRTLQGKNRTLGGGGVKNRRKSSDIIYVRSLSGRLDIFQYIYNNAENQNPIDCHGETTLHKAADGTGGGPYKHYQLYSIDRECQHNTICKLISDNIGDKNPLNFNGKTPIQMAVKSNHSLVVNVLTHH